MARSIPMAARIPGKPRIRIRQLSLLHRDMLRAHPTPRAKEAQTGGRAPVPSGTIWFTDWAMI